MKFPEDIMTKKKVDWKIVCTGIVCLTGYGIYAASQGINGFVMSTIIGIIALTVGVTIEKPKFMK